MAGGRQTLDDRGQAGAKMVQCGVAARLQAYPHMPCQAMSGQASGMLRPEQQSCSLGRPCQP